MNRILLLIACLWTAPLYAQPAKIGVKASQFITLEFPEEIVDLEIGSAEYVPKAKGRYLLLKARHKKVAPTSLLVRYGEEKQGYIAELAIDEKAPMLVLIENTSKSPERAQENPPEVVFDQDQDYYTIGLQKQGLSLIVTNILHQGSTTYLRIFIDNQNAIPCKLSQPSFEYITYLSRFLLFTKEQHKMVTPLQAPQQIALPANRGAYFVFAIPAYASADELLVALSTKEGGKNYPIYIPSRVLLKAKSK